MLSLEIRQVNRLHVLNWVGELNERNVVHHAVAVECLMANDLYGRYKPAARELRRTKGNPEVRDTGMACKTMSCGQNPLRMNERSGAEISFPRIVISGINQSDLEGSLECLGFL